MLPMSMATGARLSAWAERYPEDSGRYLRAGIGILALLGMVLWLVVISVRRMRQVWRARQRSCGRYNKRERAVLVHQEVAEQGWYAASALARGLADARVPDGVAVWGIVLPSG